MTWLTALSIGFAADTLIALWLAAATHKPEWLQP
jgi:hypothetical protein